MERTVYQYCILISIFFSHSNVGLQFWNKWNIVDNEFHISYGQRKLLQIRKRKRLEWTPWCWIETGDDSMNPWFLIYFYRWIEINVDVGISELLYRYKFSNSVHWVGLEKRRAQEQWTHLVPRSWFVNITLQWKKPDLWSDGWSNAGIWKYKKILKYSFVPEIKEVIEKE